MSLYWTLQCNVYIHVCDTMSCKSQYSYMLSIVFHLLLSFTPQCESVLEQHVCGECCSTSSTSTSITGSLSVQQEEALPGFSRGKGPCRRGPWRGQNYSRTERKQVSTNRKFVLRRLFCTALISLSFLHEVLGRICSGCCSISMCLHLFKMVHSKFP